MGTVVMHNVVSVDGFIADANDEVGPLFDWYGNGDVPIIEGGPFKVSRASAEYVRGMWASIGVIMIGRHLFDLTNGWEGQPPTGDHVVVVTHRPTASCTCATASAASWTQPRPVTILASNFTSAPHRHAVTE